MQKILLLCINILMAGASQVLIWSQHDVANLNHISLGETFDQQTLFTDVVLPNCNDFNIVIFDAPKVTYEQLAAVAAPAASEWSNLRGALEKSAEERLVNYDHSSGLQPSLAHCSGSVQFNSDIEEPVASIDEKIGEVLQNLGEKASNTIFILRSLTGQEESHNVVRRSVQSSSSSSDGIFVWTEFFLFYAANITFQPLGVWRMESGEIMRSVGHHIPSLSDNGSYMKGDNIILKLKSDEIFGQEDEYQIEDFTMEMGFYPYQNSQWFTQNYTLSYTVKAPKGADQVGFSRLDPQYIASVLGYSYACGSPWVIPMGGKDKNAYQANLLYNNVQIDVNFDGQKNGTRFEDAVACESVLGTGMVMGFIVTLGGLFVFIYAIIMFQALKNPVFGDKQIQVSQE